MDKGGEDNAARMLSPVARLTLLPPGLCRLDEVLGSMSSADKNDVSPSSDFVLVMVRKESMTSFCCDLGVPLRSKICTGRCQF